MGVPSEVAFTRRYRGLSAAERREFVAALWAACGWETTCAASDAGHGATVVVARRDERMRRIAVGTPVPDDADVVVDETGRSAAVRRRAEAVGASRVSPADLRDKLLYGVDRDTADRLFCRHFGVDLATAATTDVADDRRRVMRAWRSVVAGERPATGRVRSAAVAVAAVALLIAVAAVLFPGSVPLLDAGTESADADRAGPSAPVDGEYAAAADVIGTPASAERTAASLDDSAYLGLYKDGLTGTVGSTARTPPGAFLTGVYDPDALADAHVAAVSNVSSASLLLVASGPANATDLNATTGGSVEIAGDGGVDLAVESATRYRLTGSANASVVNATHNGTVTVFADGDDAYERAAGPAGVETRRLPSPATPNGTQLVATAAAEPIRRFLNGSNSTVRPAATELPLYRVTVTGEPTALGDEVRDFRSVAFVTADGLVLELSATYVHAPTGERVRVAFRYDGLDDTVVVAPGWYWESDAAATD